MGNKSSGSLKVNPSIVIGSFLVRILPMVVGGVFFVLGSQQIPNFLSKTSTI